VRLEKMELFGTDPQHQLIAQSSSAATQSGYSR
jgi:hypothetical protein